ncbi:MAG: hypothetical protein P8L68_14605 [Paracoccaceae bacterium]|nr:hypothetical protein [Paracoccaceae bacterium]MDG1738830.1 hypothetical protein [Paracoccaceae bacterium]MDG2259714.1 hypothetical protein [Paracoccaceae bacterium]
MSKLRLLTIVTAVNYAALIGVGVIKVMPATGGLKPFDLRYFGYSYDDALTYLSALRFDTAELLLGPVRWLDTSFPLLFAATLIGWGWVLAARAPDHIKGLTVLLPLGYLSLDYVENHLVAKMISGALPSADQVQLASSVTVGKFLFVAACILLLAVLGYRDLSKKE